MAVCCLCFFIYLSITKPKFWNQKYWIIAKASIAPSRNKYLSRTAALRF